ncbi:unnamed protein product, partial [Urochloa humidicola]
ELRWRRRRLPPWVRSGGAPPRPPPWVRKGGAPRRSPSLVPEGGEAEHPTTISIALREPPQVTIFVCPRAYHIATSPSDLLLSFFASKAPAFAPDLARQFT